MLQEGEEDKGRETWVRSVLKTGKLGSTEIENLRVCNR